MNSVIAIADDKSLVNCSSTSAKDSLIYSYGRSFNGFAAKLTDEEVARFSGEIVQAKQMVFIITIKIHVLNAIIEMGYVQKWKV